MTVRRAVSLTFAAVLTVTGGALTYYGVADDAPRRVWLIGPFLLFVGLMWFYDDLSNN